MDVIFELQRGRTFSIEVGFFDTVLEIKEKVQKYQHIPISKQTLFFNGQVLQNDGDVWKCEILQNSRIQLHIDTSSSDHKPNVAVTDDTVTNAAATTTIKLHLNIKTVSSLSKSKSQVSIEMDKNDTVLKLKERVNEIIEGGVGGGGGNNNNNNVNLLSKLILHAKGTILHDNNFLRDCENVSDNCEIEVSIRAPAPTAVTAPTAPTVVVGGGGAKNKSKMNVFVKSGGQTIQMEVNGMDNVGELKKELNKMQQNQRVPQFYLPPEGYFFICNQVVMTDDKPFRWHNVNSGDTIEIFKGCVTGGS